MPDSTLLLSQFYIKISGQEASEDMMRNLVEATVESSLHLPDVATLVLHDPNGTWVDDDTLAPGKPLTIDAKAGDAKSQLFDGEIVELESDFTPGERRVVVRAFDRLHRLSRGRHVRSYVNMTDSDIVHKIAQEANLQVKFGPKSTVNPYVLQDNSTNLDFLRERAMMLGYLLYVRGSTLHCEPYATETSTVDLAFGEDLREFHPRMTTVDQIVGATAGGWDPKQREAIVGKSQSPNGSPSVGNGAQGGSLAQSAFSMNATILVADRPIRTQAAADTIAQASLDRRAGRFVEAEGTTRGSPPLVAGVKVKLSGVGTRFSGTYFVTGSTHSYTAEAGYITHFLVSGFQASSLLGLLGSDHDGVATPRPGVFVGIVTDNQDPDNLGRVKVKFPWLSQDHASDWARVVVPGGGPQRGMQFLPEVNDEVLVGFEQGDINYPYVLGGLWNGKDAPPSGSNKVISGGKVNQRIIQSRSGHIITLDDSDNAPSITIVDKTGKNTIKLESSSNKLTVHLEGDMVFEAPSGDITIKSKTINMTASDSLKVKGQTVDTEADTSFNIKAGTDLKLKGTNTDMQGDASVSVKGAKTDLKADTQLSVGGSAMTQVTGAMIQIG